MSETVERVKFANKLDLTLEAVDMSEVVAADRKPLESVYKTICEAVIALPTGKGKPIPVPDGATPESLKRNILGYAAKHYEQHFGVKPFGPAMLIVFIKADKKPPKPLKPAPTDQGKS